VAREMMALLVARPEQMARVAIEKAFAGLLRLAKLHMEEATTEADLMAELDGREYTNAEIAAVRKGAVDFVKRYSDSQLVQDYAKLFEAMVGLEIIEWPGDLAGKIFVWESDLAPNRASDPRSGDAVRCVVTSAGKAMIGEQRQMRLSGGAFYVREAADQWLLAALKDSSELTLELTITPVEAEQTGPARIVGFTDTPLLRNFTLAQEGRNLIWRLRPAKTTENGMAAEELVVAELDGDGPYHVLITYKEGVTRCFINGEKTHESDAFTGDFSTWAPMRLVFGN
jgi:hypothetical protein